MSDHMIMEITKECMFTFSYYIYHVYMLIITTIWTWLVILTIKTLYVKSL